MHPNGQFARTFSQMTSPPSGGFANKRGSQMTRFRRRFVEWWMRAMRWVEQ